MAGLYFAPPSQNLRLELELAHRGWDADQLRDEERKRREEGFRACDSGVWVLLNLLSSGRCSLTIAQEWPEAAMKAVVADVWTGSGSWRMHSGRLVLAMDDEAPGLPPACHANLAGELDLAVVNGIVELPYMSVTLTLQRDNPQYPLQERPK